MISFAVNSPADGFILLLFYSSLSHTLSLSLSLSLSVVLNVYSLVIAASRSMVNSFHESYSTYSSSADVLHLARALEKVSGAARNFTIGLYCDFFFNLGL